MSDADIWHELEARVAPHQLETGAIFQRDVLRFRSFVASQVCRGRLALVGDAAHTVPPTGAKGLNLAIADVLVLARALRALFLDRDEDPIERYADDILPRIWRAQHFSWWMTQMLHLAPDATEFDRQRQLGELRSVVESEAGRRFLAEAYTGWPMPLVQEAARA
jgi:p-hydroxybenzoate 3-monooxygenase